MTILVLVISCEVNQLPCLDVEQLFFLQTSQSAKLCRSTTSRKLAGWSNQILCIRVWSVFNSFIKSYSLIHLFIFSSRDSSVQQSIHPSIHPSIHFQWKFSIACYTQSFFRGGREGTGFDLIKCCQRQNELSGSYTNLDQISSSGLDHASTSKSQPNISTSTKLKTQNIDKT